MPDIALRSLSWVPAVCSLLCLRNLRAKCFILAMLCSVSIHSQISSENECDTASVVKLDLCLSVLASLLGVPLVSMCVLTAAHNCSKAACSHCEPSGCGKPASARNDKPTILWA